VNAVGLAGALLVALLRGDPEDLELERLHGGLALVAVAYRAPDNSLERVEADRMVVCQPREDVASAVVELEQGIGEALLDGGNQRRFDGVDLVWGRLRWVFELEDCQASPVAVIQKVSLRSSVR
jgi:hypothetical protein